MDRPIKTINELIKGKTSFTQETAFQLEAVTGIEASFWTNADRIYPERASRLEEGERLHHDRRIPFVACNGLKYRLHWQEGGPGGRETERPWDLTTGRPVDKRRVPKSQSPKV